MADRFLPVRKTHSEYLHERFVKIRSRKIKIGISEVKDPVKEKKGAQSGWQNRRNKATTRSDSTVSSENQNDLDINYSQESTFSSGGELNQSTDDSNESKGREINETYNNNLYLFWLQNEILDGVNAKLLNKLGIPRNKVTELGTENILQYSEKKNVNNKRNLKLDKKLSQMLKVQESDIGNYIDKAIWGTPFKVLDAPNLKDDYYLNLLDWSWQDFLAVGLCK